MKTVIISLKIIWRIMTSPTNLLPKCSVSLYLFPKNYDSSGVLESGACSDIAKIAGDAFGRIVSEEKRPQECHLKIHQTAPKTRWHLNLIPYKEDTTVSMSFSYSKGKMSSSLRQDTIDFVRCVEHTPSEDKSWCKSRSNFS
jgi:hypothetical protein